MVSKTAVIAIVAILAVPIFLGYALNMTEITETDYRTTGETVNATPLLMTGISYSYVNSNIYQLNSRFIEGNSPMIPDYENVSGVKSSIKLSQDWLPNDVFLRFSGWGDKFAQGDTYYTSTSQNLRLIIYNDSVVQIFSVDNVTRWYYDAANLKLYYSYYAGADHTNLTQAVYNIPNNNYGMSMTRPSGNPQCLVTRGDYNSLTYVDLSSGYRLSDHAHSVYGPAVLLPEYTRTVIMTVNLDSISEPNYRFTYNANDLINGTFTKTTTDGVVSWKATFGYDSVDLYYNPDITNNTYQILINANISETSDNSETFDVHTEYRYVGGWPSFIGEANYFTAYTDDRSKTLSLPSTGLTTFSIYPRDGALLTPTIRMDMAEFRGTVYRIIEDVTYTPSAFKLNPSTMINDIGFYGKSLTFGGTTFNVSDGKITLDGHNIPVDKLVFTSYADGIGGYDNKIGNTIISNTLTPSTLTFNGRWAANVTTMNTEEYENTKMEWKAGDFAWDGIDHNFIMAGLLASLGAFVGVGIYARRTKATIWPLLIVCGGAALLFFMML